MAKENGTGPSGGEEVPKTATPPFRKQRKGVMEEQATLEAARRIQNESRMARIKRCSAVIEQVMKQERCRLTAIPALTADGRITASVAIEALSGKDDV